MKYLKAGFLVVMLFVLATSQAQDKQKAEKNFITALNRLVSNATSQHWAYDDPFGVDSLFHIMGDSITATFKYKSQDGEFRIRYAAPIHRINRVVHDNYLILEMQAKEVQVYEKIKDGNWLPIEKRQLLHIALVENDKQEKLKADIEKAWNALRMYYYEE